MKIKFSLDYDILRPILQEIGAAPLRLAEEAKPIGTRTQN
jgi:hypothetical protein